MGAVFFGSREIISSNLKGAKSTRSIIEHAALLNLKQAALLEIMLRVLVLIMQHALHAYILFPHIFLLARNNQKHHKKYF